MRGNLISVNIYKEQQKRKNDANIWENPFQFPETGLCGGLHSIILLVEALKLFLPQFFMFAPFTKQH